MNIAKNTICLWYDHDAEEAARFYAETFPDSSVGGNSPCPWRLSVRKKGRCHYSQFYGIGYSMYWFEWWARI